MPFSKAKIDPTFDRAWIAQTGGFMTWSEDLDADGNWQFCADDLEAATALIENYPVEYLAERLPEATTSIEARAQTAFLAGFTPATGPLAGKTLQCRDNEDRTNWLASSVAYQAAIGQGQGDTAGATFRTAANETIVCTFAEGFAALIALQQWGAAIMARSWALKDACAAAADIHALDAVLADLDNGWPGAPAV
jgi:hypothetical protein